MRIRDSVRIERLTEDRLANEFWYNPQGKKDVGVSVNAVGTSRVGEAAIVS